MFYARQTLNTNPCFRDEDNTNSAQSAPHHNSLHPVESVLQDLKLVQKSPSFGLMFSDDTSGPLFSVLQLVLAFSNDYTVTCMQLLRLLRQLPPIKVAAAAAAGAHTFSALESPKTPRAGVGHTTKAVTSCTHMLLHGTNSLNLPFGMLSNSHDPFHVLKAPYKRRNTVWLWCRGQWAHRVCKPNSAKL